MASIDLTPDVLRVLAHGLYDLNKGDRSDCATAEAVEAVILKAAGLIRCGDFDWDPASEATQGWIQDGANSRYVWMAADGTWVKAGNEPVPEGARLFKDCAQTMFLREISNG